METAQEVGPRLGVASTCAALGVAAATYYRRRKPQPAARTAPPGPPRTLPATERASVLDLLHEPRFVDLAPAQVYAGLLDEKRYLCSERTMYRILEENQEVRERRAQLRHPSYAAPQLLATAPNQLWSWDITKLLGPAKWTYFYLYVILDVFSRYVVGWMVAHRETAVLAEKLIRETCARQGIVPGQLTIHADRGSSMTSKPVALLLADLGVVKSHSRPYVSDDNPFSESLFGTMKGLPAYPEDGRFESDAAARAWVEAFVHWYNHVHLHSAIRFVTPADRHFGRDVAILEARHAVYQAARQRNPERWTGETRDWSPPRTVRLNPKRTPDRPASRAGRRHRHHRVLPPAAVGSQEPAGRRGRKHRPSHAPS